MRPTNGMSVSSGIWRCGAGTILLADKAGADQAGQADAEDRERQAGRHLVDRKAERQHAEDRRQRRTGEDAAQRADQRRSAQIGAGEAAGRAHDHHALDAEIEHARALDHQFARRRQQQRRRRRDHRQDDGLKQQHGRAFAARRSREAVDDQGIAGEHVEQQNALKHLGESSGTFIEICAPSPPMNVSARNSPAIRMPIGLRRPRNATMMAVKP